MIDIHSHFIYDIDDGAKSITESINILREAKNVGFSVIVATPHLLPGYFSVGQDVIRRKIEIIKEKIKKEKINIEIYEGREIYINFELEQIDTLAGSKYALIELPMYSKLNNTDFFVEKLKKQGIRPILAHPERYSFIQNNIEEIDKFINTGWLIQCNYASLIGKYGFKAKSTIKKLLKQDKIDFLASDNHSEKGIYTKMPEIIEKLNKLISKEQFDRITEENGKRVILNEEIKK